MNPMKMDKKELPWWLAEQVVLLVAQVGVFLAVRSVFEKLHPTPKKDTDR